MERLRVSTSDGKYTVIQKEDGAMRFLRYGEPWLIADKLFANVGMILALAQDLDSARSAPPEDEKKACEVEKFGARYSR